MPIILIIDNIVNYSFGYLGNFPIVINLNGYQTKACGQELALEFFKDKVMYGNYFTNKQNHFNIVVSILHRSVTCSTKLLLEQNLMQI